jgi:hypothetical protein
MCIKRQTPPNVAYTKYIETKDNDWSFNQGLVKLAQAFNLPLGTAGSPRPLSVKHYVIIGVGVKTLERYSMRDAKPTERFAELAGRHVVLEPIFGDGDGTVPCEGAEISTATKAYYIPYVKKTNFFGMDASEPPDMVTWRRTQRFKQLSEK